MSAILGPVRTFPGNVTTSPPSILCDDSACAQIAIKRIQGETTDTETHYIDYCKLHFLQYEQRKAIQPVVLEDCQFCEEPDQLQPMRDDSEGMTGSVYQLCKICADKLRKRNAQFNGEAEVTIEVPLDKTIYILNLSTENLWDTERYCIVQLNPHDHDKLWWLIRSSTQYHEASQDIRMGLSIFGALLSASQEHNHVETLADKDWMVYIGQEEESFLRGMKHFPEVAFGMKVDVLTVLPKDYEVA